MSSDLASFGVVAQLPPSDEELEYLATVKLPGAKGS